MKISNQSKKPRNRSLNIFRSDSVRDIKFGHERFEFGYVLSADTEMSVLTDHHFFSTFGTPKIESAKSGIIGLKTVKIITSVRIRKP